MANDDIEKLIRAALEVGKHMRRAQKEYFTKRSQENLVEAKRLEAAFDLRLAELGYK